MVVVVVVAVAVVVVVVVLVVVVVVVICHVFALLHIQITFFDRSPVAPICMSDK